MYTHLCFHQCASEDYMWKYPVHSVDSVIVQLYHLQCKYHQHNQLAKIREFLIHKDTRAMQLITHIVKFIYKRRKK